jgi:hypothetical protein
MEIKPAKRKLALRKTSLRELTAAEFSLVAGGWDTSDTDFCDVDTGTGGFGESDVCGIFESAVCSASCGSCFGCSYTCPATSAGCPQTPSAGCPQTPSAACPPK